MQVNIGKHSEPKHWVKLESLGCGEHKNKGVLLKILRISLFLPVNALSWNLLWQNFDQAEKDRCGGVLAKTFGLSADMDKLSESLNVTFSGTKLETSLKQQDKKIQSNNEAVKSIVHFVGR